MRTVVQTIGKNIGDGHPTVEAGGGEDVAKKRDAEAGSAALCGSILILIPFPAPPQFQFSVPTPDLVMARPEK